MKNLILVLAVMAFTVSAAFAQYSTADVSHSGTYSSSPTDSVTIKGYLIDEMCAEAHMSSLASFAATHATECALKAGGSGLGVVYKGQWVPFDDKGTEKAVEILKKASSPQGMKVAVTGTVRGSVFAVSKIKESKSI